MMMPAAAVPAGRDGVALVRRLWVHETLRVFQDRLIDDADRDWLMEQAHSLLLLYHRFPAQPVPAVAQQLTLSCKNGLQHRHVGWKFSEVSIRPAVQGCEVPDKAPLMPERCALFNVRRESKP